MKISLGSNIDYNNLNTANGFGYATDRMVDSLRRLGHEVNINDKNAPVEIWFNHPNTWKWTSQDSYKIGYFPFETTALQPGWQEKLEEADEVWVTSPLLKQWYEGLTSTPMYVYEHGVDKIWSPAPHIQDGTKYLTVGIESARKNGWEVLRSFRRSVGAKDGTTLTMKGMHFNWNIPQVGKVSILTHKMPLEDLVDLFRSHDVYVHPSSGEGFGLPPLQAMACGIPTITVPAWAPYARFIDPNLAVSSELKTSPWQEIHPGKFFRISKPSLDAAMVYAYENYDECKEFAMEQVSAIKREYDWDTLTRNAFESLESRLKNSQKSLA